MKPKIISGALTLMAAAGALRGQQPAAPNPIYRVTVVERTMKAINYQYRSGPTMIDFRGTPLLPAAKGEATVESHQGRTEIDAKFEHLTTPQGFGLEYMTYVLWAITPEGRPQAIAEIVPNSSNKASIRATTDLQAFGLMITAEPYAAVHQPSDVVVAENVVRDDTVGKIEQIDAKYELLPRGRYTWQVTNALRDEVRNAPKVSMGKYEALVELYQAENAVAIARNGHADQYAPETFGKAQQLLAQAERLNAEKPAENHRVVEYAREASQTAEDARLIAERHAQEVTVSSANAKAAAAEQAKVQAEANAQQARADADAARLRAEQEAAARRRAESESAAAANRVAQVQADANNRILAANARIEAANNAAASAAASKNRQYEEDGRKGEVRSRLLEQLNATSLITRDTGRGIVVTVSESDFSGSTLKAADSSQLARISQIVAAFPGLRVRVEGYTDVAGTESVATRRAQLVRDALVSGGLSQGAVESVGMGTDRPVTSNASAAGREENRRVEIVISGDAIGKFPLWDHPYTLRLSSSAR